MGTTTQLCKCCGAELEGKFCSNCGQRADTKRLTAKSLWVDFVYSIGNIDRGIVYTLKRLFTHPGSMIKEYLEGRRVVYTKPITLLIVLTTILGLLSSLMYYSQTGKIPGSNVNRNVEVDGLVEILGIMEVVLEKVLDNTLILSLLMIPFFAWMTRLFFRKYGARSYNYAELLFMNIFMTCQRFVYDILIQTPIEWIFGDIDGLDTKIMLVSYIALLVWCFKGIFTAGWIQTIWRSISVYLLAFTAAILALLLFLFLLIGVYYLFDINSAREVINTELF